MWSMFSVKNLSWSADEPAHSVWDWEQDRRQSHHRSIRAKLSRTFEMDDNAEDIADMGIKCLEIEWTGIFNYGHFIFVIRRIFPVSGREGI
jgi:hypothetical protein